MPCFDDFYRSAALAHPLDVDTTDRVFSDAVNHRHGLSGLLLTEDETPIGFSHITAYYATEVAGVCLMIEDLYIAPKFRGRGLSLEFFDWLFRNYSEVKRFRLEVTQENQAAIQLYKRLGFKNSSYNSMVLDV